MNRKKIMESKITSVIKRITLDITNEVIKKSAGSELQISMVNVDKELINVRLVNLFKQMSKEALKNENNPSVETAITTKFNTILANFDYSKGMEHYNVLDMSPLSDNLLDSISTMFLNELYKYKFDYMPSINKYASEVDKFIKDGTPQYTINDLHNIIPIVISPLTAILFEKNMHISPLANNYQGSIDMQHIKNVISSDLELRITIEEEFEHFSNDEMFNNIYNRILSINNTEELGIYVMSLTTLGINPLTVILIQLSELVRKGELPQSLVTPMIMIHDRLTYLFEDYKRMTDPVDPKGDVIICSTCGVGKKVDIYVIKHKYEEYIKNNGNNHVIVGSIINDDNSNQIPVRRIVRLTDIQLHSESFRNNAKSVIDNLVLTSKLNIETRLRSFWEIVIANDFKNESEKLIKVNEFLNTKTIVDLTDTKNMSLTLFRMFLANNENFNMFIDEYSLTTTFIKNPEPDASTAFSLLMLIVRYFVNQTEVVVVKS